MPIKDYPFEPIGCPLELASYSPVLPIRVINPQNNFTILTWGLIDTGAQTCTIPEYIAKEIGHSIKDGHQQSCFTAGGIITVYEHMFRIEVLKVYKNGKVDEEKIVYTTNDGLIAVSKKLPIVLLGVNNFLKPNILTIDYDKLLFSIQKPQKTK